MAKKQILLLATLSIVLLCVATASGCGLSGDPPQTASAGFALGDVQTRAVDGMVMVYVPGGEFRMGSIEGEGHDDEWPVHAVTVNGFWVDRTEVTNAQFASFMNEQSNQGEGGVAWLDLDDEDCLIERGEAGYRPKSDYGDHPVVGVSWYAARAYCEWAGGRLPTEAEWEYAARGEQSSIYPWGDEFDGTAVNFCDVNCSYEWRLVGYDDGYQKTSPVDAYPEGVSWCGAQDLVGNVWEWSSSLRRPYPYDAGDGREDLQAEGDRVLRGGSWLENEVGVRAAYHLWLAPDAAGGHVGFRCAMDE